ncbi:hypothetical protein OESDEN_09561 [Oesophagostomum dentatum]|uniref:Uncharacterized protein n=1 Tax=Oesophagostomum dentatum TaxID=61180 RepID=A0A0B1T5E1_OESDE|nr:hypothetical protein OESDEN_09561 [Oesophagostomum dentatum]
MTIGKHSTHVAAVVGSRIKDEAIYSAVDSFVYHMLCLYFSSSLGQYAGKKAEYPRETLHSRRHDSSLGKMSQRELQKWFLLFYHEPLRMSKRKAQHCGQR